MIPFDFVYCRPESLTEAAQVYAQGRAAGLNPFYYGGGSEIITMSRAGDIRPGLVIDVKAIPDCRTLGMDGETLALGAARTLNEIKESKLFPLLGTACGRVADHTNQCRITLGGNLCGTIIYRETALPLLLADAQVVLHGPEGRRAVPLAAVFGRRMQLRAGELVVELRAPAWALSAPYAHIKKTAQEKIDYPLVNVTALRAPEGLRAAFSGVCAFPFRSAAVERVLNDAALSPAQRAEAAAEALPAPVHGDVEDSAAYRRFVFQNTLRKLLEEWEHAAL